MKSSNTVSRFELDHTIAHSVNEAGDVIALILFGFQPLRILLVFWIRARDHDFDHHLIRLRGRGGRVHNADFWPSTNESFFHDDNGYEPKRVLCEMQRLEYAGQMQRVFGFKGAMEEWLAVIMQSRNTIASSFINKLLYG